MMQAKLGRALALLGSMSLLLSGFFFGVRPWYRNWGATSVDVTRALPGDEILPGARAQETRVIEIEAPVDRVWPWLAQIGQDRAGFYTFDRLENLAGCRMPAGDRLLPERQSWKLGDKLWMYPPERAGGVGFAVLQGYIPGRALCFATHAPGSPSDALDGSWSFILEPADDRTTRFIIRGRGPEGRSLGWAAFDQAIYEPMHFVMERGMMAGLKERAEGSRWPFVWNDVYVALWALVFVLILVAGVKVFRAVDWGRALGGFVLSCLVFQLLTLGQPPLAVSAALVAALLAVPWWPKRRCAVRETADVTAQEPAPLPRR